MKQGGSTLTRILLLVHLLTFISQGATLPSLILNSDQGLPQSNIIQLFQDSRGFLWVCTGAGLVRYDGEQIKTYHPGNGYPFSLVNKIIETGPNEYLISDYSEGLWMLLGESVIKIPLIKSSYHARITDMAKGLNGEVIVSTNAAPGFYIIKDQSITHWDQSRLPELKGRVYSLAMNKHGNIYLGTDSNGLYTFKDGKIIGHVQGPNSIPSNAIRFILPLENGEVWLGTPGGLATPARKELGEQFNRQFNYCTVNSIFQENENSIWISTIEGGGGLIHFDGHTFSPFYNIFRDGINRRTNCVLIDKSGTMFLGSSIGLITIPNRNFSNYGYCDGLTDTYIKGIAEDSNHTLWVGTKQKGLFYQNGSSFVRLSLNNKNSRQANILSITPVKNQVWAATLDGLIIVENYKQVTNEITKTLEGLFVRSIAKLPDGSLTITCKKHIFLYRDNHLKEITYNFNDISISIWKTDVDRNNSLIAATNSDGVWKLSGKQWVLIPEGPTPIKEYHAVIGMSRTADGLLMLASKNGAFSWDGQHFVQLFDMNIPVWNIIGHPDRELWISTSKGLYRKTKESLSCYNRSMGLAATEFNMQSSIQDHTGTFWFGGIGGLIRYKEQTFSSDQNCYHTFITEIKNDQETILFPRKTYTFAYNHNSLAFSFSLPCYKTPGKVTYRYKLDGYDTEYQPGNQSRSVQYTNLPHGSYNFMVQGRSESENWPAEYASFKFKILTPWWLTWWAYALYALAGLLLLYGITKLRVRHLHFKNKTLEELVEIRLQELKKNQKLLEAEIKERTSAELALKKEKENLAGTLASIQDSVIKTDNAGNIVFINPEGLSLLGLDKSQVLGQKLSAVISLSDPQTRKPMPTPFPACYCNLFQKQNKRLKLLLSTSTRGHVLVNVAGAPVPGGEDEQTSFVFVVRNIDRQHKTEEELLKTQKLHSVGLLAGGIAHDFNNILAGILGNTQLAMMAKNKSLPLENYLKGIEKATLSAKSLTKQLLTFSKGGEPVKENTNIARDIESTVSFFLRGKQVKAEYRIEEKLWPIFADMGQINQVLNNLVINACQAMPGGGTIHIEVSNTTLNASDHENLEEGPYIHISIQDSGKGIPPEVLPHIFDPFFSTKKSGKGLGLATSYAIINKHGGTITATSEPGKGTTFALFLPALPGLTVSEPEPPAEIKQFSAKILFMDDDISILEFAREVFDIFGYEAVLREDGLDTVIEYEKSMESGSPFDLVILDWTVPGGMGGEETARRILELNPDAKILVSSGYSNQGALANYEQYGFVGILPKPYEVNDLRRIISKILS